jgi:hypothetical protein
MGQGNSLCHLQIYTNLLMRNKILPISQLGCLLNRSRNSLKSKHNVAGYTTKIARFRKVLWFMNKNTYVTWKSECNDLVVVMGKYLFSAHLYSTICGLQTWVLGFWQHEDLMDGNWLSATWNEWQTDSMHLE